MRPIFSFILCTAIVTASTACGGDDDVTPFDAGMEPPPDPVTLRTTAPVRFVTLYDAVTFEDFDGDARAWLPVDLSSGPSGDVWLVQRADRKPGFDDVTECTARGAQNFDPDDDDCDGLLASTVQIVEPTSAEAATEDNGRALLVSDANSWHFMRRPSAIAFGAAESMVTPSSEGAQDPSGTGSLITEPVTLVDLFATCHEHHTGNFTDEDPFIGPTLWTADPAIYNGRNGTSEWSNGSHVDMVHATQNCMGIAWERDNVYWTFNGMLGAIERYDFAMPHLPGHFFHGDATVTRYTWGDAGVVRVPNVPSNMIIGGTMLFVADTGNGRVIAIDTAAVPTPGGNFVTFEGLEAQSMTGLPLTTLADADTLGAAWGGAAEPSGLALLDDETLVVANHATGHITLLGTDGELVRTIDTGLGEGLGGLAVQNGVIYFVQMTERRVYRLEVDESEM